MTVSMNTLVSGLRANSELTEAAQAAYESKHVSIIEMIWKWLTGETENSDDFKAALPLIFHALEQHREITDEKTGEKYVSVWLTNKKCLWMKQSADGLRVEARVVTVGGYFKHSLTLSSLEVVDRGTGSGTVFEQLRLKLAKEVIKHFGESAGPDSQNISLFNGFESVRDNVSNVPNPITIERGELLESAQRVITEPDAPSPSRTINLDEELANQEQLQQLQQERLNGSIFPEQIPAETMRSDAVQAFAQNTPDLETIKAVRAAITSKLEDITSQIGWTSAGRTIKMDDGVDQLSPTKFETSAADTEWCLVRTNLNFDLYEFVTATSARGLIINSGRNPYTQEQITPTTFIRGVQLLEWLEAAT